MRIKKINIMKRKSVGFNTSGEETYEFVPSGHFFGKVTFSSSAETWNSEMNFALNVVKVYSEKRANIGFGDRFEVNGTVYLVEGNPEFWENNLGYRNAFVVTGKVVDYG